LLSITTPDAVLQSANVRSRVSSHAEAESHVRLLPAPSSSGVTVEGVKSDDEEQIFEFAFAFALRSALLD
jgi:hypothetical protein